MKDRTSPKMTKTFVLVIRHRSRARQTSDGVFLPTYYIVGRRQKRSWECSQPFFRRSLVLKVQKARVFKAFMAFGRDFQRSSVGIFRASFYLKMNTKKTPCKKCRVSAFLYILPSLNRLFRVRLFRVRLFRCAVGLKLFVQMRRIEKAVFLSNLRFTFRMA